MGLNKQMSIDGEGHEGDSGSLPVEPSSTFSATAFVIMTEISVCLCGLDIGGLQ